MVYLIWFIGIIICILSFIIYLKYICNDNITYKKYLFEYSIEAAVIASLFSWILIFVVLIVILLYLLRKPYNNFIKYLANKIFGND